MTFQVCSSAGNFFFAGARLFFRSLEAAIFLFSRVARIPEGSQVLPAICTEERITLGAELLDGSFIRGQHSISHPSESGACAVIPMPHTLSPVVHFNHSPASRRTSMLYPAFGRSAFLVCSAQDLWEDEVL